MAQSITPVAGVWSADSPAAGSLSRPSDLITGLVLGAGSSMCRPPCHGKVVRVIPNVLDLKSLLFTL